MNATTNNSSNEQSSFPQLVDMNTLLSSFGFTWLYADLNMYSMTPVSIIGFILNIISFFVFNNSKTQEFNSRKKLYDYLRVYCLNSAVVCFVAIFAFSNQTIRLFKWSMDYWPEVYFTWVYVPITNICYLVGTFLDIVILVDRISQLNPKFVVDRFSQLSPYKMCAIMYAVSSIINISQWLSFSPLTITVPYLDLANNSTSPMSFVTLCIVAPSSFSSTTPGLVIYYFTVAIREVAVLVIELSLSIISIVLLKRHLSNKIKISQGRSSNRLSSMDRSMSMMVICLCLLSFAEYTMSLVVLICNKVPGFNFILFILLAHFGLFAIVVKHALNFFLFFGFNKRFKNACGQIVANYSTSAMGSTLNSIALNNRISNSFNNSVQLNANNKRQTTAL